MECHILAFVCPNPLYLFTKPSFTVVYRFNLWFARESALCDVGGMGWYDIVGFRNGVLFVIDASVSCDVYIGCWQKPSSCVKLQCKGCVSYCVPSFRIQWAWLTFLRIDWYFKLLASIVLSRLTCSDCHLNSLRLIVSVSTSVWIAFVCVDDSWLYFGCDRTEWTRPRLSK